MLVGRPSYNILQVDDELFHSVYDCDAEMNGCKDSLGVAGDTTKQLRNAVRDLEFEKNGVQWTTLA